MRRGKADWTNREARLPPQGVRCREAAPNQGLHLSERFFLRIAMGGFVFCRISIPMNINVLQCRNEIIGTQAVQHHMCPNVFLQGVVGMQ